MPVEYATSRHRWVCLILSVTPNTNTKYPLWSWAAMESYSLEHQTLFVTHAFPMRSIDKHCTCGKYLGHSAMHFARDIKSDSYIPAGYSTSREKAHLHPENSAPYSIKASLAQHVSKLSVEMRNIVAYI